MFAQYLHSQELLDAVRLKPTAFLRHRKLPFTRLISFLLSGTVASVQNELNVFAANLDNRADLWREVSAQAFAKARQGFSAKVFDLLNQHLLRLAEQHLPTPRWRGFRLVAADASKLQLFLKDAVGRRVREAIAFALYLPGPELSLRFELYAPSVSASGKCCSSISASSAIGRSADPDRGYPAGLGDRRLCRCATLPFCMRVDDTGFACVKAFRRSGQREALVTLRHRRNRMPRTTSVPRKPLTVRLDPRRHPQRQMPHRHDLAARLVHAIRPTLSAISTMPAGGSRRPSSASSTPQAGTSLRPLLARRATGLRRQNGL